MHTSLGDIDIELWSKEAPLACRNFTQLCMEGYYNKVVFHRVVPQFIVQGGDPTGTGEGGESIYGKPFKDEFHSRLRFVRRGLVAMANSGKDDNGSQFFFTLASCTDLNKKHTIFGKVTGDTIYNLVRLGEVELSDAGDERPVNPPYVKWTKVLANPFDDIEPRTTAKEEGDKQKKKRKKERSVKATKDFKLLSFGDEAEEDEQEDIVSNQKLTSKGKSSHDHGDEKLSSKTLMEVGEETMETVEEEEVIEEEEIIEEEEQNKKNKEENIQSIKDKLSSSKSKKKLKKDKTSMEDQDEDPAERARKESRRVAKEILESKKAKIKEEQEKKEQKEAEENKKKIDESSLYGQYKQNQKKYKKLKSEHKKNSKMSREEETLAMLNGFKSKLMGLKESSTTENDEKKDNEAAPGVGDSWLLHKFELEDDNELRDAKDMNRDVTEDRFDIYDPRNPLNKRKRENNKKSSKNTEDKSAVDKKRRKYDDKL